MGDARTIGKATVADRTYYLIERDCDECGESHYYVERWAGFSFSRYNIRTKFDPSEFEAFVRATDATMAVRAEHILDDFKLILDDVNDPYGGLEIDGSYVSLLIDYARVRLCRLQERKLLQVLRGAPTKRKTTKIEDFKMAFELGFAAAELRFKDVYEDLIRTGYRLEQGRELGLPAACEARRRMGSKRRKAVIQAARGIFADDPTLAHNKTATARMIESKRLETLRKSDGKYLGVEAIVKHLREAQRSGQL